MHKSSVIALRLKVELSNHQSTKSLNSLSIGIADVKYPPGVQIGLRWLVERFYVLMLVQREIGVQNLGHCASTSVYNPDATYQLSPLYQDGWFWLCREDLVGSAFVLQQPQFLWGAIFVDNTLQIEYLCTSICFFESHFWLHLCPQSPSIFPLPSFCLFFRLHWFILLPVSTNGFFSLGLPTAFATLEENNSKYGPLLLSRIVLCKGIGVLSF